MVLMMLTVRLQLLSKGESIKYVITVLSGKLA